MRALKSALPAVLAACAAAAALGGPILGVETAAAQGESKGARLFAKVWTASEGLGPLANAQSCAACHSTPRAGGSGGGEPDAVVLVSDEEQDETRGHLFGQLLIRPGHAVLKRPLPRQVFRRRAPSLFGLGMLEPTTAAPAAWTRPSVGTPAKRRPRAAVTSSWAPGNGEHCCSF